MSQVLHAIVVRRQRRERTNFLSIAALRPSAPRRVLPVLGAQTSFTLFLRLISRCTFGDLCACVADHRETVLAKCGTRAPSCCFGFRFRWAICTVFFLALGAATE
jgi:hypothetical protein